MLVKFSRYLLWDDVFLLRVVDFKNFWLVKQRNVCFEVPSTRPCPETQSLIPLAPRY